jgi:pimeloyl-ACP methyl ester carboxylesterase
VSVRVHLTPFRPLGTGLKERVRSLSGLKDVVQGVRRLIGLLVVFAVVAPGAPGGSGTPPRMLGPFLKGADSYWLWRAHGTPKSVVVFEHGLDESELNPANHQPWIEHLVQRGNDVVYPRYENVPGGGPALRHSLIAIHAALLRLGRPRVPLVLIGYSRGGRIAVELAAVAWRIGLIPAGVMSVFPSELNPQLEEIVDFTRLPHAARVVLLAGQEDSPAGVHELLRRLRDDGFPPHHVEASVILTKGRFHADHLSALQAGPEARRQFWDRLDRLIRAVT